MKMVFFGTPRVAIPSLERLISSKEIKLVTVVTHPDRPKGRGRKLSAPPIKEFATSRGIRVIQPEKVSVKETCSILEALEPDLFVVVSFGEILSSQVLSIPKIGSVNLHFSLLPKYRGAAPIAWAIMNGEEVTGVTVFWISEKMDSGDIILQKEERIYPEDTRGSLEERLSYIGADLLLEALLMIKNGTTPRIPQDNTQATYAPKLKKEDGVIDWNLPARVLHNRVRGLSPWPGCYTFLDGKRLFLWKTEVKDGGQMVPGMVVDVRDRIGVGTGKGVLWIEELQLEGKKRMNAREFLNGCKIDEGKKFGNPSS